MASRCEDFHGSANIPDECDNQIPFLVADNGKISHPLVLLACPNGVDMCDPS